MPATPENRAHVLCSISMCGCCEKLQELLEDPPKTGLPAGWIAVADRLPAEDGEYLAAYRNRSGRWSMILDTYDEFGGQRVWFSNSMPTGPMPIQYWHEVPAFPHGELSK